MVGLSPLVLNFIFRHLPGLLNARVLNALRTSEIKSLSLVATLGDENGLNIAGVEPLRGECEPINMFPLRMSCSQTTSLQLAKQLSFSF
jgi:hypothetical protein